MDQQSGPFQLPHLLAGRFTLERELGGGGFGVVYLARQEGLDRPVAVKVLLPAVLGDPEQVGRFLDEARITATLSHPNIVRVIDSGQERGLPWIAYEHLGGAPLAVRLDRGPLPVLEAVSVTRQIASALDAAHARGVLHRDVKVENVLVDEAGTPKLADFGIARWTATHDVRTAAGQILGTPESMAPEYVRTGEASPSCDLYALGVLLFRLLTGRPPFTGDSIADVLESHLTAKPPRPGSLAARIPPPVDQAVLALLEKDPASRLSPASGVVALLAKLESTLREMPVSPAHQTQVLRSRRARTERTVIRTTLPAGVRERPTRRPVWLLWGSFLLAGLGLGAHVLLHQSRPVTSVLSPAPPSSPSAPGPGSTRLESDHEDSRDIEAVQAILPQPGDPRPEAASRVARAGEIVLEYIRRGDARRIQGLRWLHIESPLILVVQELDRARNRRLRDRILVAAASPSPAAEAADPCRLCLALAARTLIALPSLDVDQRFLEKATSQLKVCSSLRQMDPAGDEERLILLNVRAGKIRGALLDYARAYEPYRAIAATGSAQAKRMADDAARRMGDAARETLVLSQELLGLSPSPALRHMAATTAILTLKNVATVSDAPVTERLKEQLNERARPLLDLVVRLAKSLEPEDRAAAGAVSKLLAGSRLGPACRDSLDRLDAALGLPVEPVRR